MDYMKMIMETKFPEERQVDIRPSELPEINWGKISEPRQMSQYEMKQLEEKKRSELLFNQYQRSLQDLNVLKGKAEDKDDPYFKSKFASIQGDIQKQANLVADNAIYLNDNTLGYSSTYDKNGALLVKNSEAVAKDKEIRKGLNDGNYIIDPTTKTLVRGKGYKLNPYSDEYVDKGGEIENFVEKTYNSLVNPIANQIDTLTESPEVAEANRLRRARDDEYSTTNARLRAFNEDVRRGNKSDGMINRFVNDPGVVAGTLGAVGATIGTTALAGPVAGLATGLSIGLNQSYDETKTSRINYINEAKEFQKLVDKGGSGIAEMNSRYTGAEQNELLARIEKLGKDKLSNMDIKNLDLSESLEVAGAGALDALGNLLPGIGLLGKFGKFIPKGKLARGVGVGLGEGFTEAGQSYLTQDAAKGEVNNKELKDSFTLGTLIGGGIGAGSGAYRGLMDKRGQPSYDEVNNQALSQANEERASVENRQGLGSDEQIFETANTVSQMVGDISNNFNANVYNSKPIKELMAVDSKGVPLDQDAFNHGLRLRESVNLNDVDSVNIENKTAKEIFEEVNKAYYKEDGTVNFEKIGNNPLLLQQVASTAKVDVRESIVNNYVKSNLEQDVTLNNDEVAKEVKINQAIEEKKQIENLKNKISIQESKVPKINEQYYNEEISEYKKSIKEREFKIEVLQKNKNELSPYREEEIVGSRFAQVSGDFIKLPEEISSVGEARKYIDNEINLNELNLKQNKAVLEKTEKSNPEVYSDVNLENFAKLYEKDLNLYQEEFKNANSELKESKTTLDKKLEFLDEVEGVLADRENSINIGEIQTFLKSNLYESFGYSTIRESNSTSMIDFFKDDFFKDLKLINTRGLNLIRDVRDYISYKKESLNKEFARLQPKTIEKFNEENKSNLLAKNYLEEKQKLDSLKIALENYEKTISEQDAIQKEVEKKGAIQFNGFAVTKDFPQDIAKLTTKQQFTQIQNTYFANGLINSIDTTIGTSEKLKAHVVEQFKSKYVQGVDIISTVEKTFDNYIKTESELNSIFKSIVAEMNFSKNYDAIAKTFNASQKFDEISKIRGKDDLIESSMFNEINQGKASGSTLGESVLNNLKRRLETEGVKSDKYLSTLDNLFKNETLKNTNVRFDRTLASNVKGFYDVLRNEIVLNPNGGIGMTNDTVVHELIHAISHEKIRGNKDFLKLHEAYKKENYNNPDVDLKSIITPDEFLSEIFENPKMFNDVLGIKGFRKFFNYLGDNSLKKDVAEKMSGATVVNKDNQTPTKANITYSDYMNGLARENPNFQRRFYSIDERAFNFTVNTTRNVFEKIKTSDEVKRTAEIKAVRATTGFLNKFINPFKELFDKIDFQLQDVSSELKKGLGETADLLTEYSLRHQMMGNKIDNRFSSNLKGLKVHMAIRRTDSKTLTYRQFMSGFENSLDKMHETKKNDVQSYMAQNAVLGRLITDEALTIPSEDGSVVVQNGVVVNKDAFLSHSRTEGITIGKLLGTIENLSVKLKEEGLLDITNQYMANSFISGKYQFDIKDGDSFVLKHDAKFKKLMTTPRFGKQNNSSIDILSNPNSPFSLLNMEQISTSDVFVPLTSKDKTFEKEQKGLTQGGVSSTDVNEYVFDDFDPYFEVQYDTGFKPEVIFKPSQNVLERMRENVELDEKNALTLYLHSIGNTLTKLSLNNKGNERVKVYKSLNTAEEIDAARNKVMATVLDENGNNKEVAIAFESSAVKENYLLSLDAPSSSKTKIGQAMGAINTFRKKLVTTSPTFIINNLFNNIAEQKVAIVNLADRVELLDPQTKAQLKDWGGEITPFKSQYNELKNLMSALVYIYHRGDIKKAPVNMTEDFKLLDQMYKEGAISPMDSPVTSNNDEKVIEFNKFDDGFFKGFNSTLTNKENLSTLNRIIQSISDIGGGADIIRHATETVSAMSMYRILNKPNISPEVRAGVVTSTFPIQSWGKAFYSIPELKSFYWFVNPMLKGGRENYRLFRNAFEKGDTNTQKRLVAKLVKYSLYKEILSVGMIALGAGSPEEQDERISGYYDGSKDFDGKALISFGDGVEIKLPIGNGATNMVDKFVRATMGSFMRNIDNIPDDIQLSPALYSKLSSIILSNMTLYKPRENRGEIGYFEATSTLMPELIKPITDTLYAVDQFGNPVVIRKDEKTETYAYANELKTPETYKSVAKMMYDNAGIDMSPKHYEILIDKFFNTAPTTGIKELFISDSAEIREMKSKKDSYTNGWVAKTFGVSPYFAMKGLGDETLNNVTIALDKFKRENASNIEQALIDNPQMNEINERIKQIDSVERQLSEDVKSAIKENKVSEMVEIHAQRVDEITEMKINLNTDL